MTMAQRRYYRTVREAQKDGFVIYDRNARLVILWKEVRTVYGTGYLWAEVQVHTC